MKYYMQDKEGDILHNYIFKVNSDKFPNSFNIDNDEKIKCQIQLVIKRILNKNSNLEFKDYKIGLVNDDFVQNKCTLKLTFVKVLK